MTTDSQRSPIGTTEARNHERPKMGRRVPWRCYLENGAVSAEADFWIFATQSPYAGRHSQSDGAELRVFVESPFRPKP
jgi:hypothetical protein